MMLPFRSNKQDRKKRKVCQFCCGGGWSLGAPCSSCVDGARVEAEIAKERTMTDEDFKLKRTTREWEFNTYRVRKEGELTKISDGLCCKHCGAATEMAVTLSEVAMEALVRLWERELRPKADECSKCGKSPIGP